MNARMVSQHTAYVYYLREKAEDYYSIEDVETKEESALIATKMNDLKKMSNIHKLLADTIQSDAKLREM